MDSDKAFECVAVELSPEMFFENHVDGVPYLQMPRHKITWNIAVANPSRPTVDCREDVVARLRRVDNILPNAVTVLTTLTNDHVRAQHLSFPAQLGPVRRIADDTRDEIVMRHQSVTIRSTRGFEQTRASNIPPDVRPVG